MGRGSQQQEGTHDPADAADRGQCNQDRPLHFQMVTKCSTAESKPGPQGNSVGGVSGDGRDSGEQQGREGNKTSAAGDSIKSATQGCGQKQNRDVVWIERADAQARNVTEPPDDLFEEEIAFR